MPNRPLVNFEAMWLHAVRIGLEESFGLIVDGAGGGLRVEIEGVVAGEVDFDGALAAAHGVEAGADEVAVEKNVARRGEEIDAGQSGLKQLRVAADGVEIELAGALRANSEPCMVRTTM